MQGPGKYSTPGQLPALAVVWALLWLWQPVTAQYAPPAGQPGSTAMYRDSSAFVAWADSCVLERGWVNIALPDSGLVSFGDALAAVGKADLAVVSLGDGGSATIFFSTPVSNGPGFDLAVFENAFLDDFLELAFVEVSSDGETFFRFPSVSLTPTEEQVETFGRLDATLIHNLAGKYRATFGVPFDLEELKNENGLDVNNIVAVRVTDVVGSIDDAFATFDAQGNKLNDPWPTPFPTGGFDLDAVGVIHNRNNTDVAEHPKAVQLRIVPNPVKEKMQVDSEVFIRKIILTGPDGRVLQEVHQPGLSFTVDVSSFPAGLLLARFLTEKGSVTMKILKQ